MYSVPTLAGLFSLLHLILCSLCFNCTSSCLPQSFDIWTLSNLASLSSLCSNILLYQYILIIITKQYHLPPPPCPAVTFSGVTQFLSWHFSCLKWLFIIYVFTSLFPITPDKKLFGSRDSSVLLTSDFPTSGMEKKSSCDFLVLPLCFAVILFSNTKWNSAVHYWSDIYIRCLMFKASGKIA